MASVRALVLVFVMLVVGLTGSPAGSATGETAGRAAPLVGECHDLTYDQLAKPSDTRAPVDCAATHTTLTVHVGTIPEKVWRKGKVAHYAYGVRVCRDAWEAYFGVSRKLLVQTLFSSYFYFVPSKAEAKAGARYIRCDVAARAGTKVFPIAADPRFTELTPEVAKCMNKRYYFTTCTGAHTYYPVAAVTLPRRPAEGQEARVVGRRCLASTGKQVAAVSWPAGDWSGSALGVCYRRD